MTHQPAAAFAHTLGGPADRPRIVIVGEAWGKEEQALGKPFVGESGKELFRMLGEAIPEIEPGLHKEISEVLVYGSAWAGRRQPWFEAAGICMTNVLAFRPPDNKVELLCGKKKEVSQGYFRPPIKSGQYLKDCYLSELDRLKTEIDVWSPNLILGMGNTASWALLSATNIGSIRGTVAGSHGESPAGGRKVLPTYHPAGVLRQWSWRPIVVADLMKANREASFPELRRPTRRILINPSLSEAVEFINDLVNRGSIANPVLIAADTETEARQITCISLAASPDRALVIPFWDKTRPGWSYWPEAEERVIWDHLQFLLESPRVRLLWQNGMYDFQYITPMKIKVHRSSEDTMLLHHALYPELQKGLGFLGSIYTNEASWKLMRNWKSDSEKRDE